jgi:hypothetical protein
LFGKDSKTTRVFDPGMPLDGKWTADGRQMDGRWTADGRQMDGRWTGTPELFSPLFHSTDFRVNCCCSYFQPITKFFLGIVYLPKKPLIGFPSLTTINCS